MKMDQVAGSQNDEFFTPPYAIWPLLKYIPSKVRIWCPFDTEESHFVKMLRRKGCDVLATHIKHGEDFFTYEIPFEPHYIISNPPYSKKTEVLERLFWMGIPFAMLVGVVGLFESQRRFSMFRNNQFEVMYFNKRIAYLKNFEDQIPALHPPFSSVYITKDLLPNRIVFEEISKEQA